MTKHPGPPASPLPAYVISLRDPDHGSLRTLMSTLEGAGFKPCVLSAVRGADLSATRYFEATVGYYTRTGRMLSPAEAGCALSHLEAARRLAASGARGGLILEDDVIADAGALRKVFRAFDPPPAASLMHFGGVEGFEARVARARGRPVPCRDGVHQIHPKDVGLFVRAVAYGLDSIAARRLIARFGESGGADAAYLADDFEDLVGEAGIASFFYAPRVGHPLGRDGSSLQSERSLVQRSVVLRERRLGALVASRLLRGIRRRGATLARWAHLGRYQTFEQ